MNKLVIKGSHNHTSCHHFSSSSSLFVCLFVCLLVAVVVLFFFSFSFFFFSFFGESWLQSKWPQFPISLFNHIATGSPGHETD